ncbi:hypothetical protein GJ496_011389 [Pomphorhynchus laevis]|nr:hypothetical protein GJ496_011389 [Pomphorhynchus laevis]
MYHTICKKFCKQAEIQQFKVYELSGRVSFFFEETKEKFSNEFQNLDIITVNDISVRITAMVHDVPIFVEDRDLKCLLKNYGVTIVRISRQFGYSSKSYVVSGSANQLECLKCCNPVLCGHLIKVEVHISPVIRVADSVCTWL